MFLRLDAMPDLAKGDELAINVGSDCAFTSDVSGLTWLPDQPYFKGSWGYIEGKARSTTSEIENTTDGPLYQTWRENLRAYQIDAPSGTYEVELLMADVSRSRRTGHSRQPVQHHHLRSSDGNRLFTCRRRTLPSGFPPTLYHSEQGKQNRCAFRNPERQMPSGRNKNKKAVSTIKPS